MRSGVDTWVIVEDGRLLTCTTWTLPSDWQTLEVERGDLGSMKGTTPTGWPTLDAEDSGEGGVYP